MRKMVKSFSTTGTRTLVGHSHSLFQNAFYMLSYPTNYTREHSALTIDHIVPYWLQGKPELSSGCSVDSTVRITIQAITCR
jgi:hypothetical protein